MNLNQIILKIKSCKSYNDCAALALSLRDLGWQVNLKLGTERIWKGCAQNGDNFFEFALNHWGLQWHYNIKGSSEFFSSY